MKLDPPQPWGKPHISVCNFLITSSGLASGPPGGGSTSFTELQ
eukprot:UN22734